MPLVKYGEVPDECQEKVYSFTVLRQEEQEFKVQRRFLLKSWPHFNVCYIFLYLSIHIQERPFLALGTLSHGLPSNSTKIQGKMSENIVSHRINGIAERSTDTSCCQNSKWILFDA